MIHMQPVVALLLVASDVARAALARRLARPSFRARAPLAGHRWTELQLQSTSLVNAGPDPHKDFEAYKKKEIKPPPEPGPGAATGYDRAFNACDGCITFYPVIGPTPGPGDPPRQSCRYGSCNLRDPQTQPWGGVMQGRLGPVGGSQPDYMGGWWHPEKPLQCFTTDAVSWFKDCNELLWKEAKNVKEVSHVCEYMFQLNVLGPFVGQKIPFVRLNTIAGIEHENCATVIEDAWRLYDDINSFN